MNQPLPTFPDTHAAPPLPIEGYDEKLGYIILPPRIGRTDSTALCETVKGRLRECSGRLMEDFPGFAEISDKAAEAYFKALILYVDVRAAIRESTACPAQRAEREAANLELYRERISFIAYQHENKLRHYYAGPEGRRQKERIVGNNVLNPCAAMGRVIKHVLRAFHEGYTDTQLVLPQNYLFYTRRLIARNGWDARALSAVDPTCAPPQTAQDGPETCTPPLFRLA